MRSTSESRKGGAAILNVRFAGRRRALTDGTLAKMLLRYPLMTLKVVFAIHFEAGAVDAQGGAAPSPHS